MRSRLSNQCAGVHGCRRRRAALGFRAQRHRRDRRDGRPRSRCGAAARVAGACRRSCRGGRASMARRCRSCRSSTRSSAPAAACSTNRSIASGLVRTQTPQGARRQLLLDAFAAADRCELHGRGRAPREPRHHRRDRPRRGDEPQGHRARRISRSCARSLRASSRPRRAELRPRASALARTHTALARRSVCGWAASTSTTAPRLYGHSDGDVVLHAAATAVLSAAGLGDLGRLFPANRSQHEGDRQRRPARRSRRPGGAAQAGRVDSAQVSLVGARPKLGREADRRHAERIAQIARRGSRLVSITASTGNLYGPEGAGLVISATCLVAVHRR